MMKTNHGGSYQPPVEGEPLQRAANRREGRGPLESATAGVQLGRLTGDEGKPWKVAQS